MTAFALFRGAVFSLLVSFGAGAFVPPKPIGPGTTNAPGPALDESTVTLRWLTVEGATSHRLSVRDLTTWQLATYDFAAPETQAVITLTGGHEFRWNMRAFIGTNQSEFSETLYFQVNPPPVRPTISDVAPNPVPALDGGQPFVIYGDDFLRGCMVVLRDEQSGQDFDALKVTLRQVGLISVTANFTHAEGQWSVEVVNPGGYRSERFYFEAVSPEQIPRWRWWRSGWPWVRAASAALLCVVAISSAWWFGWKPRLLAEARTAGAHDERIRLLRDLHDDVSGELTHIGQLANKGLKLLELPQSAGTLRVTLHSIWSEARNMSDSVGDLLWAAKPANQRLPAVVAHLRERINARLHSTAIIRDFKFPVPVPELTLTVATSQHLLRITNEVLNNVLKHSGATVFTAGLELEGVQLRLTLADNGRGFDPDLARNRGHGLSNLENRAKAAGGTVEILSRPSVGTQVRVVLPLRSPLSSPSDGDSQRWRQNAIVSTDVRES